MKLFFLLISALFFLTNATSQKMDYKEYEYVKSEQLKNFEGTWLSIDKSDSIKIILTLEKKVLLKGFKLYIDVVHGQFYINSIRLQDTANLADTLAISNGMLSSLETSIVNGSFLDKRTHAVEHVELKLLDNNTLQWKFFPKEHVLIGNREIIPSTSVASKMIFKRKV